MRALIGAVVHLLLAKSALAETPQVPVLAGVLTLPAPAAESATFGGLSAIDYDMRTDTWLVLSDDRGEIAPPRFWRAQLQFGPGGLENVALGARHTLRPSEGGDFASGEVDPEALRFDPCGEGVFWSSEQVAAGQSTPVLRTATREGVQTQQIPLPDSWTAGASVGGQDNATLEGFTFDAACGALWLAMEGPLKQDGALPHGDAAAIIRLVLIDRVGRPLREVAYRLDPIRAQPDEHGQDTGISEILRLDDRRLLVLERSGVRAKADGTWSWHCRLYLAEVGAAADVSAIASFRLQTPSVATKSLIVDFDALTTPIHANLEGMAWGPPQADGVPPLVLVSDNNFKGPPTLALALRLPSALACAAPTAKCVATGAAPR